MSEQLHDDTFTPWTIADGRCVVASEAEWARIERAAVAGKRILVRDVFAEWDGKILLPDGDVAAIECAGGGMLPIETYHIRTRLFSLIDRTAATWCIETRHPEDVLTMIPDGHWRKMPCPKHSKQFQLECPACNGKNAERVDKPRPNLHLYAGPLFTQADADAMIPHLLRCPAAMRGLVVTPREGIDLRKVRTHEGHEYAGSPRNFINHVVIRGDDKPMHPAHVRGIIEQCEAAGVPVWFDGKEWRQLPEVKQ